MLTFTSLDEARYLAWARAHPGGYVINCRSANDMMLLKPDCEHFRFSAIKVNLTAHTKVCSTDKAELERWAAKAGGTKLEICRSCSPR